MRMTYSFSPVHINYCDVKIMKCGIVVTVLFFALLPTNPAVGQYLHLTRDKNGDPVAAEYAGNPEWLTSQKDPLSHLHAMAKLEEVVLYLHDITLAEMRYVASLTQVRNLTLGHCPEKVGMEPGVLDVVAQCRHIECLWMCKSNLVDADVNTLSRMANLKILGIEGEDLCDAKDRHGLTSAAVDPLVKMKSLEWLEIRGDAGFTDQDVEKLASLSNLKRLELRSRYFTDNALEVVASRMKLTHIRLESPHFTEEAITKLRNSKRIESVDIQHYSPLVTTKKADETTKKDDDQAGSKTK